MYLTKTSFIAWDKLTKVNCTFYPVTAYLIYWGLHIDKYPALKNDVTNIKKEANGNEYTSKWMDKQVVDSIPLKIPKLISYLYRFFFFDSQGNSDKFVCSYLSQYIISYFSSISHYYFHRHSFLCLTFSVSSFYIRLFCRLHNHTISACLFNTFSSLFYWPFRLSMVLSRWNLLKNSLLFDSWMLFMEKFLCLL